MPSGRIFKFIVVNGVENANKVCTRGPKKLMIGRILVKVIFGGSAARESFSELFFSYFDVFSDSSSRMGTSQFEE